VSGAGPPPAAIRLERAADALGLALPPDAAPRLARYAEELLRWNRRIRLVGPSSLEAIVDEHLVDALGFARLVRAEVAPLWYDVGAGAGLPGLVLAVVRPDLRFILVEPTGKKVAFMTQAAALLRLANVAVEARRVEALPPAGGPCAALSRATFAPEEWARRGAALVGPGGHVLVALGAADAPALRALAAEVDTYALPTTGAARTNLLIRVPDAT